MTEVELAAREFSTRDFLSFVTGKNHSRRGWKDIILLFNHLFPSDFPLAMLDDVARACRRHILLKYPEMEGLETIQQIESKFGESMPIDALPQEIIDILKDKIAKAELDSVGMCVTQETIAQSSELKPWSQ